MTQIDPKVFAAMQTGKPYKSYIKTMLGKLYIVILDPFDSSPKGIILKGNPKNAKTKETCIIDVWDETQDVFFKRAEPNKRHFAKGYLIEYHRAEEEQIKEKPVTEFSDEELVSTFLDARKLKFAAFQSEVNKLEQSAVLIRLIDLARENEKSEKMISVLESKLSELQEKEFTGQE